MSDDVKLRSGLVRLASSLPKGSVERRKVLEILAAAPQTFVTENGTKFTMQAIDLARLLASRDIRGAQAGEYLREETPLPNWVTPYVREFGGKMKGPERDPYAVPKSGPNIQALWDALVKAIWAETKDAESLAKDMFINSYEREDDFEGYLAGISGDVAQSWEDALGTRSEGLYAKFKNALQTGQFHQDGYERWNLREKQEVLRDIYADAWYEGMSKAWGKIQANPRELARLRALRPKHPSGF